MAKQKKKKRKETGPVPPPLSFVDRMIYFFISILLFGVLLLLIFLYIKRGTTFAFSKESVLAFKRTAAMLWAFPLFIVFASTVVWFVDKLYEKKQPVFGNKKVTYGISSKYTTVYPIFGKNYPKIKRPKSNKKNRYWELKAVLLCYLITIPIFLLSLSPRWEATKDNVSKYNCFDMKGITYPMSDVVSYEVTTCDVGGKSTAYTFDIVLKFKHKTIDFTYEECRNLESMYEITKQLKGRPKTVDSSNLDQVLERGTNIWWLRDIYSDKYTFSKEQMKMIDEMFDLK